MNKPLYYTGVGSRRLPAEILEKFEKFGEALALYGLTLRSGAADGADRAFEKGCDLENGSKEIYLPWKDFNNSKSDLYYLSPEAYTVAEDVYGYRWKWISEVTKKFMTRNTYQVSGVDLDQPSSFVICWTPDGCTSKATRGKLTGGTGQAIAYADELDIPIFNLYNPDDESRLIKFVKQLIQDNKNAKK